MQGYSDFTDHGQKEQGYGESPSATAGRDFLQCETCKTVTPMKWLESGVVKWWKQNPRTPAASAWRASSPLPIPASSVPEAVPGRTERIFRKTYPHTIAYHLPSLPAVAHTSRPNAVPLRTSTPPSRRARGPLLVITPPKSNCKQPRYVCRDLQTVGNSFSRL